MTWKDTRHIQYDIDGTLATDPNTVQVAEPKHRFERHYLSQLLPRHSFYDW